MPVFIMNSWKKKSKEIRKEEHDLSNFICPLSKIKAIGLIENLDGGETIKITLGDIDSLKSVRQELKARNLKSNFEQEGENRFVLTITK